MQKTLEVKIRSLPGQERQDQKDVSRVYLSKDTLLDMRLEAGQPCYMWKIDDPLVLRREALAWPSAQKINKNVVQMFKTFQETCDFKLEDRVAVAPSEDIQIISCASLRDVTLGIGLSDQDKPHWEWYLVDKLERAETIFHGMCFDISLKGPKRSFRVESFTMDGMISRRTIGRFEVGSSVKILDKSTLSSAEITNGAQPSLLIPSIAGIEQSLAKINNFLATFDNDQAIEPSWGTRSNGVLIHGAHGTGKTMVLQKICETGWGTVFYINVEMKTSALRDVFKDSKLARRSIIVIDDIDILFTKEVSKSHDIEHVLGEEMDGLTKTHLSNGNSKSKVLVVAATSVPGEIPRSLKKRGRFTTEILLPVPDVDSRKRILRSLVPDAFLDTHSKVLDRLGERTHAYTGEDLGLLLDKSCDIARRRSHMTKQPTNNDYGLVQGDIEEALLAVRPTAMHDITLQPPKVRWDEIGGQETIKKALRRAVETPLLYPDLIRRLGATAKKGLLLYGPPGCSKTLSAQAMATEIGFNFFAVKGAELLNMYVGESERAIREIFARARAASPSIIFFDEIESIGSKRETGGRHNGLNVLTTLLNEMDGIETLKGVTVLAATNKPEALDLALLRPGRFDDLLYVAPPDQKGREEILEVRKKRMDWADDVDVLKLAQLMDGYSGAEIVGICQAACDRVIDKSLDTGDMNLKIGMDDFLGAMEKVRRQITPELIAGYKRWATGMSSGFD